MTEIARLAIRLEEVEPEVLRRIDAERRGLTQRRGASRFEKRDHRTDGRGRSLGMTVFFKNKSIRHPEPAEGREGSPAAVFRRPGWTSHDFRPLV